MIKVYLDTNILIGLKQGKIDEFKRLKKLLTILKGKIYCFYSIAHLNDLGNDKSGRVNEDLEFFETIVDNNFLVKEWGKENVNYLLYSPKMAFEIYKDNAVLISEVDFSKLEIPEEFDDNQVNFIEYLKNQVVNLEILKSEGHNKEIIDFLTLYFGDLKDEYTVEKLITQLGKFITALLDDPDNYRSIRRSIIKQFGLSQNWNINIKDLDFDEKFQNSPVAKSFFKFVKDIMHTDESDPNYSYDFFTNAYFNFNIFGIDGEKNKGVKFSNTLYDSFHSYYGAHCHYLVTNDQGLLLKSEVLYKFYGIDSKTLTASGFVEKFSIEKHRPKMNGKTLLDTVLHQAKHGLISRNYKTSQNLRNVKEIQLDFWLLDYFNKIDVIEENDGKSFILLYNAFTLFHKIETWKDFESITSQLIEIFGPDKFLRTKFNENDKNDVLSGDWFGRVWEIGENTVYLELNHGTKLLTLVIQL